MGQRKGAKCKKTEWILFGLLIVSYFCVSFFHEPWFDEAQSWQIAKCASIKDILFEIPHYEAHPPLWHLLLSILAKTGVPYELGLSFASGIAVILSGWLLLFRSPFPKVIRCLLPFSYFLFYQYGVVSRPYGLMGLVFLLLALNFKKKNEKPVLYVILLALECLLSAYGIVLAGGIALAWVIEIFTEKGFKLSSKEFWKDLRWVALMGLLFFAILMILEISPREDTVIGFAKIGQKLVPCFLYTFFMSFPDCSLLTILKGEALLRYESIGLAEMALGCAIGAAMLFAILLFASKRMLKYFAFPYLFYACFSAYVYFATHHVGIAFLFALFWFWINWEEDEKGYYWKKLKARIHVTEQDGKKIRILGIVLGYVILVIPVVWTVMSCFTDIQKPYFYARGTANFLNEYHLDELNVLCEWSGSMLSQDECDAFYDMNTNVMKTAVSIAPYFDGNPFYNFNQGRADQAYVKFSIPIKEQNLETVKSWAQKEMPDVIVGRVNLELLFENGEIEKEDYSVVYKMRPLQFSVWKGQYTYNAFSANYVYLRKDLLEEYGLKPLGETPID
ncbi:MAG: hypothetical protein J5546_08630 [Lachnospiraceae bacterium]|nr:hypothetical protein [Lachnospiraceae bacterium]